MKRQSRAGSLARLFLWSGIAALLLTGSALGQARTSGGSSSPGGSSSGSGGGFTGSSSGGAGFAGGSSSGAGFTGGSSSGAGFTGSSGGSGFAGTTGSMTGNTTNRGSFGGGGGFGGQSGGASGYRFSMAPSNPFGSYYYNPYQTGATGASTRASFGAPIYAVTTSTSASGGFGAGGGGMAGGRSNGSNFSGTNTSNPTAPIRGKAAPYSAVVTFDGAPPPIPPAVTRARTEASTVIARSTAFTDNSRMQVAMDGETVVLRGEVADMRERRLAEALLRTTPGVHEVRNELQVRGAPVGGGDGRP